MELGPMKIKPTVVENKTQCCVLFSSKPGMRHENPPYKIINRFYELNKIICNVNPKAQAINKAQWQLRPESYFAEYFKSRAL